MNFSGFFRIEPLSQLVRQLTDRLRRRHRLNAIALVIIVILAAVFRFWNLGAKALWLDEWLTLFVINGYGSSDLPLDQLLSFRELSSILQPHPDAGVAQTLSVLNRESTHPPLFFILQHYWLQWQTRLTASGIISPDQLPIVLRSLPAAFGLAQTLLMFWVGKLAFSSRVGLLAAALTATSPLVVYLSQEARQYTLAMLCLVLALGGLLTVVKCWQYGDLRARKAVILWIVANTLGLYSHYLFLLAFVAQGLSIALWLARTQQWRKRWRCLTAVLPGLSLPLLFFLPWLWRLLAQVNRAETEWATPFIRHWSDGFAPIGQTLVALLAAFTVLPLEGQPLSLLIPFAVILLLFGLCLGIVIGQGWQRLRRLASISPESARLQERRNIIALMTLIILGQMLVAFYLFGKNLTIAPRYHAIYYPCLCLVAAIGLGGHSVYRPHLSNALKCLPAFGTQWRRTLVLGVILISTIGSVCVIQNLAFQKGYTPREIATDIQFQSDNHPSVTIAAYENLQEIALGWSILWELGRRPAAQVKTPANPQFALFNRSLGYDHLWATIAQDLSAASSLQGSRHANVPAPVFATAPSVHLWVLAPGLRQAEFPQELALNQTHRCVLDPGTYQRLGIPYQGYRCAINS